ncbi:MAG: PH domain-containing protein [SAR324 cluster bacterium]|uniref:PH domain-containing protein n=1 Tax=SAR324 cluster bacterium TaxID=2024889 RepID=A0A7X9IJA1_9DELT|nr:PH domain-containing protein [SAR324 cluster bacterium]
MQHYPSFEELVKDPKDPEKLLVLTPAYRSFIGIMVFWILTIIVVFGLNIFMYKLSSANPNHPLSALPARSLAIIPFLILLEIIRRKYNQAYVFGIDKAIQKTGLLWFTYNETVIEYGDVRSINVLQNFWGRILNFGTLDISTAAQEDSELSLQGIVEPEELAALVDQLRTHSREIAGHIEKARTND